MNDVHASFLEKLPERQDVACSCNGLFSAQAEVRVELLFADMGKSSTHLKHVDLHGSGAQHVHRRPLLSENHHRMPPLLIHRGNEASKGAFCAAHFCGVIDKTNHAFPLHKAPSFRLKLLYAFTFKPLLAKQRRVLGGRRKTLGKLLEYVKMKCRNET